jgi:hypothetical protein
MPADRAIDRAVVHACTAADAAQHVLELGAEHLGAAIVQQHHVIGLRPVGIALAARPGREGGVHRHVLPGRRPRQHAQDGADVIERRHDLLNRGHDDMHARQKLSEVAIALIGDDDRTARLGDQEVRPGDADV